MQNSIPVLLTIVLFFGISFAIGAMATRKASTGGMMSFMTASRSLPTWMVFSSTFATYAGTIVYMAWLGNVGMTGLNGAWTYFAHTAGFVLMGLFLVPILVRMKRVNFSEPLGERYDPVMQKISSVLSFMVILGNSGNVILGIGMLLSLYTSLSLPAACTIATAVMLLYTMLGGAHGLASTSAIQGLIMIVFTIVAPIVIFAMIGSGNMFTGLSTVLNNLPEKYLTMRSSNPVGTVGLMLTMGFMTFFRPDMAGTIYGAKTPKDGVKGWVGATTMTVIFMGIITILGLACRYLIPDYAGASDQYPAAMFGSCAPVWLNIFYILCLLASAVSTGAALMMGIPRHYVADFHLPVFYKNKPEPDSKKMLLISRISMVVFSLISLWWAIAWQDILTIFNFIFTVLVCGCIMPYIGLFLWPRMTTMAAKASSISGAVFACIWNFGIAGKGILPGFLNNLPAAIPALILTILVGVIVSLCGKPEYEKVYHFGRVYNLTKLTAWGKENLEKANRSADIEKIDQELANSDSGNYAQDKEHYKVEEGYTMPSFYLKGVWMWPSVVLYIILIALTTPAERLYTVITGAIFLVIVFAISQIIRKKWPM